jgi:hypothetical protein
MNGHAFAFRSPWYARERDKFGLNDPRALPPVLQKYDSTRFVRQITTDPRDSLEFIDEDKWSYPVPVSFPAPGTGRQRFATSRMVTTKLRKLYQPNHDRFYLVVVELFCDTAGLPRAGSHRDVDVGFVLRRRDMTFSGTPHERRRLSRDLLLSLAKTQHPNTPLAAKIAAATPDVDDLWWAEDAADERQRFIDDHADLLQSVTPRVDEQGWLVDSTNGTGRWDALSAQSDTVKEQLYPMYRLPDKVAACDNARTRSLWFGLVPTYSAEHWKDPSPQAHGRLVPKLDERAIYHLRTVATQKPAPGHEHCPPKRWWSVPSEPFRLAAPYDPEGTKNHKVSITAPDFRALAARAGKPLGPGGLAIHTPPGSQMKFDPFGGVPKPGSGSMGDGGFCTWAFELFFIVALFLFLMFLPIVVFAFQLWWMLALRFCFPRLSLQMQALANFFAAAHLDIVADAAIAVDVTTSVKISTALDDVFGVTVPPGSTDPDIVASLKASPEMMAHKGTLQDLVAATDPDTVPAPTPPPVETKPNDPLCPIA